MPTTKRTDQMDAIALLKTDHQKVRGLLGDLEKTTDRAAGKRQKLLDEIERELTVHTKIEEQIFYPAFREAARKSDDRELFYEAVEEHHVVDLVLPEIKKTATDADDAPGGTRIDSVHGASGVSSTRTTTRPSHG